MERLIPGDARLAVDFHLLFNLALAAVFLMNVKRTASVLLRCCPTRRARRIRAVPCIWSWPPLIRPR